MAGCGALALACAFALPADAATLRQGVGAFQRADYATAVRIFQPLAELGNASAQSYLGYMFETGRGVPRNYTEAAIWYRRAAEQGETAAQYSLGLLYDRGFGVPQNIIEANKWLNLSTAGAPRGARESRARIRDAVTSKMTRGEIARARLRAIDWAPAREVPVVVGPPVIEPDFVRPIPVVPVVRAPVVAPPYVVEPVVID